MTKSRLVIEPDYATATDIRTFAEQMVAALDAVLPTYTAGTRQSYTIGGVTIAVKSAVELRIWCDYWVIIV